MTAIIIRSGEPERGGAARGTFAPPHSVGGSTHLNFSRRFGPGSLTSLSRVHLRQEQFRGEAPVFHVDHSFRDAGELHLQFTIGASACLTRGGSHPARNGASV